jgi:hypothetical protein
MVTIPPSGAPCPDEQSLSSSPAQTRQQGPDREGRRGGQAQPFGQTEDRRGALGITARAAGRVGGMGPGHAFASASRFRAAS